MRYKRLSDGVVMDEREFTCACHNCIPEVDCDRCPIGADKQASGLSCTEFMRERPVWCADKLGFEPIPECELDERLLHYADRLDTLDKGLIEAQKWLEERANEDMVNQPAHYTSGGIECADALDAMVSAYPDPNAAALAWQVGKYIWRHPLKWNPLEDLKKARWYLDRLIAHYEKKEADNGA